MRKFFMDFGDELMDAIREGDDYTLACDYHPVLETLCFFYYLEDVGSRMMLYHLPSKRWVSPITGLGTSATGGLIGAENRFFIVNDGALHLMDDNADRREYIGGTTKEEAFIKVVGNQMPLLPKTIDTVGVISNQHTGWAVTNVTIPADATTKVDQVSLVIDEDWLTREGVTRAPVKRNLYTSGVYSYGNLWEGERMRGRVAEVKFTLPTQVSGKIEVTALEIGMTSSNV